MDTQQKQNFPEISNLLFGLSPVQRFEFIKQELRLQRDSLSDEQIRDICEVLSPHPSSTHRVDTALATSTNYRSEKLTSDEIFCEVTTGYPAKTEDVLKHFLGKGDTHLLMHNRETIIDFDTYAPQSNSIIFTPKPIGKSRAEQQIILAGAKLGFADDAEATIVCAGLVHKAREVEFNLYTKPSKWLSQFEAKKYKGLQEHDIVILVSLAEGGIRTKRTHLYLENARLHTGHPHLSFDYEIENRGAFGKRLSVE